MPCQAAEHIRCLAPAWVLLLELHFVAWPQCIVAQSSFTNLSDALSGAAVPPCAGMSYSYSHSCC